MRGGLLLLVGSLMIPGMLIAQAASISGSVIDGQSGSAIRGATVRAPDLGQGVTTRTDGSFELRNLPSGPLRIQIRHLGYVPVDSVISVSGSVRITFQMTAQVFDLGSITIEDQAVQSDLLTQTPLSTVYIPQSRLRNSVRLGGEPDPVRFIQSIPGVKTESDFSGGYSVRGGRNDQNLILFDGMPVYSPWHLFGLFSAFNAQSVSGLEFSKGIFSPRYGSRISSVLHLYAADGNDTNGLDELNIGMVSSSLTAGAPYSDKGSLFVSMRRTYMDPFLAAFDREEKDLDQRTTYYFHDLSAKLTQTWSPKWESDMLMIYSKDRFGYRTFETFAQTFNTGPGDFEEFKERKRTSLMWENSGISGRTRFKGDEWLIEMQSYYTRYQSTSGDDSDFLLDFQLTERVMLSTQILTQITRENRDYQLQKQFKQDIQDVGSRIRMSWKQDESFSFDAGIESIRHWFDDRGILNEQTVITSSKVTIGYPGLDDVNDQYLTRLVRADLTSQETAIHAGVSLQNARLSIYPGFRVEHYSHGNHVKLLPRLNGVFRVSPVWTITAGYGMFRQYVQAVGIDLLQVPVEKWIWASPSVKPMDGRTVTLGSRLALNDEVTLTVEGYQRQFRNLLSLNPVDLYAAVGGTGTFVPVYRDITIAGEGRAMGIEHTLEWRLNRMTGRFSYALSHAQNRFNSINDNQWFDSRTDSRHDLSSDVLYRFHRAWLGGAQFRYKSGQPVTIAYSAYDRIDDPLAIGNEFDSPPLIWRSKHNHRLPDYHRLDLFVTWQSRPFRGYSTDITFSLINAYNRFNVLAINTTTTVFNTNVETIVQPKHRFLGQLPVFPMLSLRIH
jgi:hypothetical protein